MLACCSKAVKSVRASVISPRRWDSLHLLVAKLISEGKNGRLIQEVCGTEQDGLFFPTFSGVADRSTTTPSATRPRPTASATSHGLGKLVVAAAVRCASRPVTRRYSRPRPPNWRCATHRTKCWHSAQARRIPHIDRRRGEPAQAGHRPDRRPAHTRGSSGRYGTARTNASRTARSTGGAKSITFNNILKYNTFRSPTSSATS